METGSLLQELIDAQIAGFERAGAEPRLILIGWPDLLALMHHADDDLFGHAFDDMPGTRYRDIPVGVSTIASPVVLDETRARAWLAKCDADLAVRRALTPSPRPVGPHTIT